MKEQIEEMRNFMLEKSNSANVEPVFTTNDGKEIVLGKELTKLLNDVLEQAFIPFLAEALYNAGYRKQSVWINVEERLPDNRTFIIACDRYGNVGEAYYFHDRFEWINDDEIVEATHWMPFPETPKMKGE